MNSIEITINGDTTSVDMGSTLSDLLRHLELPAKGCVFSINNRVVPKSEWSMTKVSQGDSLSLFRALAGG